jgi:hypothetical protein
MFFGHDLHIQKCVEQCSSCIVVLKKRICRFVSMAHARPRPTQRSDPQSLRTSRQSMGLSWTRNLECCTQRRSPDLGIGQIPETLTSLVDGTLRDRAACCGCYHCETCPGNSRRDAEPTTAPTTHRCGLSKEHQQGNHIQERQYACAMQYGYVTERN